MEYKSAIDRMRMKYLLDKKDNSVLFNKALSYEFDYEPSFHNNNIDNIDEVKSNTNESINDINMSVNDINAPITNISESLINSSNIIDNNYKNIISYLVYFKKEITSLLLAIVIYRLIIYLKKYSFY
tara:strand:+ start:2061 stop:2441 length:381 start_codon:yes stop_codon:yes gene_type:complete